jgi:hypothetical protein
MVCPDCVQFTRHLSSTTFELAKIQKQMLALERAGTTISAVLHEQHEMAKVNRAAAANTLEEHMLSHR